MRMDPVVARRKFSSEVDTLHRQRETLVGWGCWVVEADYPNVWVVFVPRHSLLLSVPAVQPAGGLFIPGPRPLVAVEIPMVSARALGVQVALDDFDIRAPALTFCDPWTRTPLSYERLCRGFHTDDTGKTFNVLLDKHPVTGRPFLCMRGVREYHEHPQHSGDDWMLYRGSVGLFAVLSMVWRTCFSLVRPNMIFVAPNQIQVQWNIEKER
jgi:hypothetical protein